MKTSVPSLAEYITQARAAGKAVGHFNIANLEGFWAVVSAAKALNVPVIIGVSEGERDFMGIAQVVALVKSVRDTGQPVYLNADHTYSFDRVREAIDAGFDAVIFDGTKLSYDENVAITKQCVEYARAHRPEVLIEGELGFIGTSSKVLEAIPDGVNITEEYLTKPEEAKAFVLATGVDMLAPAVGNIHGMLKGGKDPALNLGRIKAINEAFSGVAGRTGGISLVLHGGSGGSLEDFKGAMANGCGIIHISTELRVAYRKGLEQALASDANEVAPYRYLKPARDAMYEAVVAKLKLFNHIA